MQFLSEWVTPDGLRYVILDKGVIATFKKYRQIRSNATEAGGILVGKRRGGHIQVTAATEPMASDRRMRHLFERGTSGHADFAVQAWRTSEGNIGYVGEWHTHPQRVPTPSLIDRFEWSKLVLCAPRVEMVVIVVGTEGLHLELISTDGQIALAATSP
nr:Mov34/MPN/PAD-1 family protein [uncultured Albidiferax sp.]